MGVSLGPDSQSDILSIAMDGEELDFGPLEPSSGYLEEMNTLIHPASDLKRAGYTLHRLTPEDLNQKRRCFRCNRKWMKKPRQHDAYQKQTPKTKPHTQSSNPPSSPNVVASPSQEQARQRFRCRFHDGKVVNGQWTCCKGNTFAPPCLGSEEHTPRMYADGELERQWNFFHTPPFRPVAGNKPATAVVIDCEMGTNIYGESELIRVSVVDYFTRAILLDSLVWPEVKMIHYNTKFSGVTKRAMLDAKQRRTCIFGRGSVRKRLWKFVGPDTIVIGHAAHGDLACLRWIHPRVVDTLIIETRNRPPPPKEEEGAGAEDTPAKEEAEDDSEKDEEQIKRRGEEEEEEGGGAGGGAGEGEREQGDHEDVQADVSRKRARLGAQDAAAQVDCEDAQKKDKQRAGREKQKEGGLSLKALARMHLSRTIQVSGQGHDSLEDALATRDILHWNMVKMLGLKIEEASPA